MPAFGFPGEFLREDPMPLYDSRHDSHELYSAFAEEEPQSLSYGGGFFHPNHEDHYAGFDAGCHGEYYGGSSYYPYQQCPPMPCHVSAAIPSDSRRNPSSSSKVLMSYTDAQARNHWNSGVSLSKTTGAPYSSRLPYLYTSTPAFDGGRSPNPWQSYYGYDDFPQFGGHRVIAMAQSPRSAPISNYSAYLNSIHQAHVDLKRSEIETTAPEDRPPEFSLQTMEEDSRKKHANHSGTHILESLRTLDMKDDAPTWNSVTQSSPSKVNLGPRKTGINLALGVHSDASASTENVEENPQLNHANYSGTKTKQSYCDLIHKDDKEGAASSTETKANDVGDDYIEFLGCEQLLKRIHCLSRLLVNKMLEGKVKGSLNVKLIQSTMEALVSCTLLDESCDNLNLQSLGPFPSKEQTVEQRQDLNPSVYSLLRATDNPQACLENKIILKDCKEMLEEVKNDLKMLLERQSFTTNTCSSEAVPEERSIDCNQHSCSMSEEKVLFDGSDNEERKTSTRSTVRTKVHAQACDKLLPNKHQNFRDGQASELTQKFENTGKDCKVNLLKDVEKEDAADAEGWEYLCD